MKKQDASYSDDNDGFHTDFQPKEFSIDPKRTHPKRKRNMSYVITMMDVVIIVLLGIFLQPYLVMRGASTEYEGYRFILKNQAFAGQSMISLQVINKQGQLMQQPYQITLFQDDVSLSQEPWLETLPDAGTDSLLRVNMPSLAGKKLKAIIQCNGQYITLINKIDREKGVS
jgi:hypothetical protein